MIVEPGIVQSESLRVALIPLCVPCNAMRTVVGPALREVRSAALAQGIAETGPWLAHHWRMPTDSFDFDLCIPVSMSIAASGRVRPGELTSARIARTVCQGDYSGLGDAWGALKRWLADRNEPSRGDFWEVYTVGPESGLAPAEWRTELCWALAA